MKIVDIMRHANSLKVDGLPDLYRPLSEPGVKQAIAARARYIGLEEQIQLVLHSPAPRAEGTARIAVGKAKPRFINVRELWVEEDESPFGPILWKAFDKYQYSLAKYLRDAQVRSALDHFGVKTATKIRGLSCFVGNADEVIRVKEVFGRLILIYWGSIKSWF